MRKVVYRGVGHSLMMVCLSREMFVFVEFEELVTRVEMSLENVSPSRRRSRPQNLRNRLRRSMIKDHPVFELFVSGSSSGVETAFFCTICQRDVSIETKGVREISGILRVISIGCSMSLIASGLTGLQQVARSNGTEQHAVA